MCIFIDSPHKQTLELAEDEAVIGYKRMRIGWDGELVSPVAKSRWTGLKQRARRGKAFMDASNRTTTSSKYGRYVPGVYAYKRKIRPTYFEWIVARVRLWGIVHEYSSVRHGPPGGFRAEKARIDKVWVGVRDGEEEEEEVALLRRKYPGLKVEVVKVR